ncbi:hypothetical protein K9M79_08650 [Candidatus Woesearchaeota archaeon]|nr:hypothetical protein [Candidatus Woesearchaeota archaeon]
MKTIIRDAIHRIKGKPHKSKVDPFHLKDGSKIHDIDDFFMIIKNLPDDIFYHHVNQERNDFVTWIRQSLNMPELADKLKHIHNKEDFLKRIDDQDVRMISEKESLHELVEELSKTINEKEDNLRRKEAELESVLEELKTVKPRLFDEKDFNNVSAIREIQSEILTGRRCIETDDIDQAIESYKKIVPLYNSLLLKDRVKVHQRIGLFIGEIKNKIQGL